MSEFNEKLRVLLHNNEMRQKDLAGRLCVSEDTVQKWVKGSNHPSFETIKDLSRIFCYPIENFADDSIDIPEYYEIDRYLPDEQKLYYPKNMQDSEHILVEAFLADEGILHRFTNCAGDKCSAIYRAHREIWWHYREYEAEMIACWNETYGDE